MPRKPCANFGLVWACCVASCVVDRVWNIGLFIVGLGCSGFLWVVLCWCWLCGRFFCWCVLENSMIFLVMFDRGNGCFWSIENWSRPLINYIFNIYKEIRVLIMSNVVKLYDVFGKAKLLICSTCFCNKI